MDSSEHLSLGNHSDELKALIRDRNLESSQQFPDLQSARSYVQSQGRQYAQNSEANFATVDTTVENNGFKIPVRVWQSATSTDTPRKVAYAIHGGGWSLGDQFSDSFMIENLTRKLGMIVVTLDYRLSPENVYPTPFSDVQAVFKWITTRPKEIYGSAHTPTADEFVVCGFSAGANLAAALVLWARDNDLLQHIQAQYLFSPATCHYKNFDDARSRYKCDLQSLQTASSPFLDAKSLIGFWDNYILKDTMTKADKFVSPLLAESHAGLPPAYIQIAGADPLRDEGIAYAKALESAGVDTTVQIYAGAPHAFQSQLIGMKTGEQAMEEFVEYARSKLALE